MLMPPTVLSAKRETFGCCRHRCTWAEPSTGGQEFKKVSGGLLVQGSDLGKITADDLKVVTDLAPTPQQIAGHVVRMDCREVRKVERDHLLQRQHDDWRGRRPDEPRVQHQDCGDQSRG